MKVVFTIGLPASGKSTWAKKFCEENKDWVRVNRDDLRHMRGQYWLPKQEGFITKIERACIDEALSTGLNVIVDATNLNPKHLNSLKDFIGDRASIETKAFPVDVEECIKRDAKRANSVGEKVIRDIYEKYLAPPKVVYKEDESLPKCVIFDVDGTLAKMEGRTPFEWDKVGTDLVNEPIAELARMYFKAGYIIVIFTGRDGCCAEETEGWLMANSIPYDRFYIRPAGNMEKDAIIKKRMFEENIRGKYNVITVVDDRNQVVDMWRKELGLTCLQVDYGNF